MLERSPHEYNATSIWRKATGEVVSLELVQVIDGKIYRSNGCQSFFSGLPQYDEMFQTQVRIHRELNPTDQHTIALDGGAAYKRKLAKVMAGQLGGVSPEHEEWKW